MNEFPAFFVFHGAPTMAIEASAARDFLAALGRTVESRIGRPTAILVLSAHWETAIPTVGMAPEPPTIHDFSGFPDDLCRLRYPARGAIEAAREAMKLLADAGIPVLSDASRGLDHGAWVPLRLMIPDAGVPVSQVSLQPEVGPRHAYRVGEAVRPGHDPLVLKRYPAPSRALEGIVARLDVDPVRD